MSLESAAATLPGATRPSSLRPSGGAARDALILGSLPCSSSYCRTAWVNRASLFSQARRRESARFTETKGTKMPAKTMMETTIAITSARLIPRERCRRDEGCLVVLASIVCLLFLAFRDSTRSVRRNALRRSSDYSSPQPIFFVGRCGAARNATISGRKRHEVLARDCFSRQQFWSAIAQLSLYAARGTVAAGGIDR